MNDYYEENPVSENLQNAIRTSMLWNVHPRYAATVDLLAAVNHINLIARGFRRKLLENQHFSTVAKVMPNKTEGLRSLYFDLENIQSVEGHNPFGFGYPLFIHRDVLDRSKILVAPLFIWYVDLQPHPDQPQSWLLVHHSQNPLIPNGYLLDYLKTHYSVDFHDEFSSFCRNKSLAIQQLDELMGRLSDTLDFSNLRPPNGIKAIPLQKELARVAAEGALYWSGVFGNFPQQLHPVLHRLESTPDERPDKEISEEILPHNIGLWAPDPIQQTLLKIYPQTDPLLLQGVEGSGKTTTLLNMASNMLSSGKKVLFVSSRAHTLAAAYESLNKKGLIDLGLLLTDEWRDHFRIKDKLTSLSRNYKKYSKFDIIAYQTALRHFREAQDRLDQQFSAIGDGHFGPLNRTDTVGLFLKSHHIEGREVMANQLKEEDFQFNFSEFDIIRKDVGICEPLYKQLNTLTHPLQSLHSEWFNIQPIALARHQVEQQISYFLDKILQLKYRYFTKSDTYKTKLRQHLQQRSAEVEARIGQFKVNLNNYSSRFGHRYSSSNRLLRMMSPFSNRHKTILEAKSKLAMEYQLLEKFFRQQQLFSFRFLQVREQQSVPKIKKSLGALENQLQHWLGHLPKYLEEQMLTLSSKNAVEEIDLKAQLEELEYAQQMLLEEINNARLFANPYHSRQSLLIERFDLLDEITDELETSKLSLRDFEDFYKWQHYWISLPQKSRNVVLALIKNKPAHWVAAFESWYLHQLINKNYHSVDYQEELSTAPYLEAAKKLRTQLPAQIADRWGKRQPRATISSMLKQKVYSPADLAAVDLEAFTTFFPIVFCTPEVALSLFPGQAFDYLLLDDAHLLDHAKGLALRKLALRMTVAFDHNRHTESDLRGFVAHLQEQGLKSHRLAFQHLRRPAKLLRFADQAFGNQLFFLNKNVKLFARESVVHAVRGSFHTVLRINEIEAKKIIDLLLQVELLPDHHPPKVSIVCFSGEQRQLIAEKILQLSLMPAAEAEKIHQLQQNGLGIYLPHQMDGLQPDILLVSLGWDADGNHNFPTEAERLNTKIGMSWLNYLAAANFHKIHMVHSLSKESLQRYKNDHRQPGFFLLVNLISYLDAVDRAATDEQKNILRQLTVGRQVNYQQNGIPQNFPSQTALFLEEVGRALTPYFEAGRIKRNATIDNIILPLVVKPKFRGQRPWVIQADGVFFPGQKPAYEWQDKVQERISFLGLHLENIWSVNWWKSPQQSARILASKIIKYDASFEEVL